MKPIILHDYRNNPSQETSKNHINPNEITMWVREGNFTRVYLKSGNYIYLDVTETPTEIDKLFTEAYE